MSQLTTSEVARRLGLTPTRILQLARENRIPHTMTPLGRLYDSGDVECFAASRRGRKITMRKIPTLFRRNPEDMRHLLPVIHPDCEWVLRGEGRPTRKFDGTAVMFDGKSWWGRREVKPGREAPANFRPEQFDEETGKTVGWEPIEQSSFYKVFSSLRPFPKEPPGTYELIGPKINRNPERAETHYLVAHGAMDAPVPDELSYESLHDWLTGSEWPEGWEGIVWHHPDGRMAKLKVRDFR